MLLHSAGWIMAIFSKIEINKKLKMTELNELSVFKILLDYLEFLFCILYFETLNCPSENKSRQTVQPLNKNFVH